MKEVVYYVCESCEHVIEDKFNIEKCIECGKEICSACAYVSINDGLSYCHECIDKCSDSIRMWEIVKGMSEGRYNSEMVFVNEDGDEIFISDDGELLDHPNCTVVTMLMNDKSKWRIKHETK